MQFEFTRQFSFPLADGIDMTVKYSGLLIQYLNDFGYEFVAEVNSIDSFAVNGQTFLNKKLDQAIEDVLFDKAYEDADKSLTAISNDVSDRLLGVN